MTWALPQRAGSMPKTKPTTSRHAIPYLRTKQTHVRDKV